MCKIAIIAKIHAAIAGQDILCPRVIELTRRNLHSAQAYENETPADWQRLI